MTLLRHLDVFVAAAGLLAASAAHSAITQAPALPAQVSIKGIGALFDVFDFQLKALGSARNEGQSWIADVAEVSDRFFKLDSEAAMKVGAPNMLAHRDDIIWKNFTIEFEPAASAGTPRLWADAYDLSGVMRVSQAPFAFLGGVDFTPDGRPDGQSLLWTGGGVSLGRFDSVFTTEWSPRALAEISVSSVPELAIWQAMGLGFAGMIGLRAARRYRGVATDQA
jgi:hypothetical protein